MGPPEQQKAPRRARNASGGQVTSGIEQAANPKKTLPDVKPWVWGWPDWIQRVYSNSKGVRRGA